MARDLRKYARQTNVRLIGGGILLALLIGVGLIYWIYGQGAAVMGLLCILAGLVPIVLVYLVLLLLDWVRKRIDRG